MKTIFLFMAFLSAVQAFSATTFDPPSYGSMGASKKVIGMYPRAQITDATEFPYRVIGQIEHSCTGTLIGPRHIVTAGHCVFDVEEKSWENHLNFYPGKTAENETPFGAIAWKKVYVQKEYLETGDSKFDFAVIELEEPIGDKIGWSGYKVLPEEQYKNDVRITGYPGDKETGTLWTVSCPSGVEESAITYQCDTFGGMSGSGVFSLGQDPLYITSIHTWGRAEQNGGVILNGHNFELIKAWKNGEVSEETAVNERIPEPTFDRINFTNDCYLPVRFYLHWLDLDETWKSKGPWTLAPGETGYVADTQNRIYYFAALTTNNQFVWKGETPVNMNDGEVYLMRKAEITTDTYGDWIQKLSCD